MKWLTLKYILDTIDGLEVDKESETMLIDDYYSGYCEGRLKLAQELRDQFNSRFKIEEEN